MAKITTARPPRAAATFDVETAAIRLGDWPVAGVDEAGRGPWAGPVVAAAVILDPDDIPDGIADSKLLDAGQRDVVFQRLMASPATRIGVGIADADRIDRMNILHATMWAMAEAVSALAIAPKLVLIDGNRAPRLPMTSRTIVSGDRQCLSIAAASIIAKVTRDRMMIEFAGHYPGYGFERHKGYGTPDHSEALGRLGVTPLHRRSFRPVQLALGLTAAI
jgi:ribonuclease HII